MEKRFENIPVKVLHYDSIDSTNEEARRLAEKGEGEWTIVNAKTQTAGKGRLQRRWESPPGIGLYFSIILKPEITPGKINLVNITTSVSVAEFIREFIEENQASQMLQIHVKWPNDVWIGGKKIAGILLESAFRENMLKYLVIGIGMNINQEMGDFSPALKTRAASLRMVTGKSWNPQDILEKFLIYFYRNFREAVTAGFKGITRRYEELMVFLNEQVSVKLPQGEIKGITLGIDCDGFLKLKTNTGQRIITAGDVRGLSGGV
jgi:BirA family biotin operon repressor/biotin-[acetyl-CoA-carboxylase] ligase